MTIQQKRLSQYSACLLLENRHAEMQRFVNSHIKGEMEPGLRYYLGLSYALQGKIREALQELEIAIHKAPENESYKVLMFNLLIHNAEMKKIEQDWEGLASALSAAVEIAPDNPETREALLRFKQDLPISLLNANRRQEAARIWEDDFRNDSSNLFLLHNLSLLYYWWARKSEEDYKSASDRDSDTQAPQALNRLWKKALSYWALLLNLEEFWHSWKVKREKIWDSKIDDSLVKGLKESIFEEKFIKYFQDNFAWYKQKGLENHARRQDEYLNYAFLESKSAQAWCEALRILSKTKKATDGKTALSNAFIDRVTLPAGVLFYQLESLLPDANQVVQLLQESKPDNPLIAKLKFYFSPTNHGRLLVLIEDKKQPDVVITELDKLPKGEKDSIEAVYLHTHALFRRGIARSEKGELLSAMEDWASASRLINDPNNGKLAKEQFLQCLFTDLKTELEKRIVETCEKELKRLKRKKKLDEAIQMLEQAYKIGKYDSIKEHIAMLYCDRGEEKLLEKKFAAAREDYNKALAVYPQYERAKQRMATAYNNEALKRTNLSDAIPLLEKAIKYDPNGAIMKKNLADAYNYKAVEILNSLSYQGDYYYVIRKLDDAIRLLNRAMQLINPATSKLCEQLSYLDEGTFNVLLERVRDEQTRLILKNLWVAYQSKRNIRGY